MNQKNVVTLSKTAQALFDAKMADPRFVRAHKKANIKQAYKHARHGAVHTMNLSKLGSVFCILRESGISNRRLRKIRLSDAKRMAAKFLGEAEHLAVFEAFRPLREEATQVVMSGRVSMDAVSSGVPKAGNETTEPTEPTTPVIRLKATDDDLRGKVYVVFVVHGEEETKAGATWREGSTWIGQRVGLFVEEDQIHNESFPTRKAASEWVASGR